MVYLSFILKHISVLSFVDSLSKILSNNSFEFSQWRAIIIICSQARDHKSTRHM